MAAARKSSSLARKPFRYVLTLAVLFFVLASVLLYVNLEDFSFSRAFRLVFETLYTDDVVYESDGFLLNTPGCSIRKFDPWNNQTRHYFWRLSPHKCPQRAEDLLVYLQDGVLRVDKRHEYKLVRGRKRKKRAYKRKLVCRKWTVYRKTVEDNDDIYRISENYTEFQTSTSMDSEFAKVECFAGGYRVYHNYFFDAVDKPEVEQECAENERRFLSQTPLCDAEEERLSVLLVGIDSVSRSNFVRQLPRTHALVTSEALSAVDFSGYNKLGLNTFPCLMPYVTGESADDLKRHCWGPDDAGPFDNCTTLWDEFAAAGYRTAFVENLENFGLFTYNKGGFRRRPTHYYGRTLYLPVMQHVRGFPGGCWRGASDDEQVLRWAGRFQTAFANRSHFGHFWVSRFTHDDVNMAQHLDPALSGHLESLLARGALNSTLLVLMSDHGIRYGRFRSTEIGRLEENLPFMFFVLPRRFRDKYPLAVRRLRANARRLVTTYDLHATLRSVLNCEYRDARVVADPFESRDRSVSLFGRVSPLRTCEDAGIPAPYCACSGAEVERCDPNSNASRQLAGTVVEALNEATSARRSACEEFHLKEIVSVKRLLSGASGNSSLSAVESESYVVAVVVEPGDARFEANVDDASVVHADIRRIDRYGDTSACITDDHFLKSVCYCKARTV